MAFGDQTTGHGSVAAAIAYSVQCPMGQFSGVDPRRFGADGYLDAVLPARGDNSNIKIEL